MSDTIFNAVIKEMIFGQQFVCEQTEDVLYQYLSNDQHLENINDYLRTLDRAVRKTAGGDTFFCCYARPDEDDYKNACRQLYSKLINDLHPFLNLATTVMHINNGSPIRPGDILKESLLLAGFEQSQAHTEALNDLTKSGFFASTSPQVKGQLAQVLNKLIEDHYLTPFGHSGTQYRATGKWSMLYDFIDFQFSNEYIEQDDNESLEQVELL